MTSKVSETSESSVLSPRRRSRSKKEEPLKLQNRSYKSPSPQTKRLRRSGERENEKLNGRGSGGKREAEKEKMRKTTSPLDKSKHSQEKAIVSRHEEGCSATWGGDDEPYEEDTIARMSSAEEDLAAKKKESPSFELSGKLAEENRHRGSFANGHSGKEVTANIVEQQIQYSEQSSCVSSIQPGGLPPLGSFKQVTSGTSSTTRHVEIRAQLDELKRTIVTAQEQNGIISDMQQKLFNQHKRIYHRLDIIAMTNPRLAQALQAQRQVEAVNKIEQTQVDQTVAKPIQFRD